MSHVKSLQCDKYEIVYSDKVLNIGYQCHDIKDWWKFDDDTISNMDIGASDWWRVWKPIIKKIIKVSPAEPTVHIEKDDES